METLGPLFVPPHTTDRFWILIMLVAVPVMGAALIVLVRGRLPAVLSSYVLLLLPAVAYLLGDLHLMEESKNVEFCGSCHETMGPIVEAIRSDHDTLAGRHYRRGAVSHEKACYVCHSGYGIWGGTNAKLAGFQHMLNTVTGRYEFPLRPAGRFDIDSCRACHAAAVPFRSVEAHRDPDIQQALLAGEMGCTGVCHAEPHPASALNGAGVPQAAR